MGHQKAVRLPSTTQIVLRALAQTPGIALASPEIQRQSRIGPSRLYPMLLVLETAGWVASRWEAIDSPSTGRPRRRLYRLTAAGLRYADGVMSCLNKGVYA